MADNGAHKFGFNVSDKLNAPKPKSQAQKLKEDQEKRAREEAERQQIALNETEKYFGTDDTERPSRDTVNLPRGNGGPPTGPRGRGQGSSGDPRGNFGGPRGASHVAYQSTAPTKRRAIDVARARGGLSSASGPALNHNLRITPMTAPEKVGSTRRGNMSILGHYDDDDPIAEALEHLGPSMMLKALPPTVTEADIKALLSTYTLLDPTAIESIEILPPDAPSRYDPVNLPSRCARVTFSIRTFAPDIDTAVLAIRNGYAGCGYYPGAFRVIGAGQLTTTALQPETPFGVSKSDNPYKPVGPHGSHKKDPLVKVAPPEDLVMLKIINATIEAVLSQANMDDMIQLERELMSQPDIQKDRRWAFLYDSQSQEGVFYRWRLITGFYALEGKRLTRYDSTNTVNLFEDNIGFQPEHMPKYQHARHMGDVVNDPAFNRYEVEDEGKNEGPVNGVDQEQHNVKYLTPFERAYLTQLLAQLPTKPTSTTRKDIASVSDFVARHLEKGLEETVEVLMLNLEMPFNLMSWAQPRKGAQITPSATESETEQEAQLPTTLHNNSNGSPGIKGGKGKEPSSDTSPQTFSLKEPAAETIFDRPQLDEAKLVALRSLTDIMHIVRPFKTGWNFLRLLEGALNINKTFHVLGRLDRDLNMGGMRKTRWLQRINEVLKSWDENAFHAGSIAAFKAAFANPPLTAREKAEDLAKEKKAKEAVRRADVKMPEVRDEQEGAGKGRATDEDLEGIPMDDDLEGIPMDDDLEGIPMDDDLDDVPMRDNLEGVPMPDDLDDDMMA